jgi:hypothetical protein
VVILKLFSKPGCRRILAEKSGCGRDEDDITFDKEEREADMIFMVCPFF